jgi:hypothetical protein
MSKSSIVINTVMEPVKTELPEGIAHAGSEVLVLKQSYSTRASEPLGRIETSSELAVIFHYVLELGRLVDALYNQSWRLLFEDCLLWVFVSMICHLVQMFVLNRDPFLNRLFSKEDISMLVDGAAA